jgi:spermidine/putrescine-binding protein
MRKVLVTAVAALLVSVAAFLVPAVRGVTHAAPSGSKYEGELDVIDWLGYTDPSFKKRFQQQTGCTLKVTDANSSDEMFAKFRAGGGTSYDLVSASGDASLRFIQSGAVQAVDLNRLTNWKDLLPQLKSPAHNTVNGKHYGISFMWGPDVLIYSTKVFKKAPTTWRVLYDKKYSGKITVPDNAIQIADVAVMLGYKTPYNLSSSQLATIKTLLKQQRPLVRHYWGSAGEFTNLFKSNEVVLGAGWPLMTVQLKAAGAAVGETIPREGATGWADTWMLNTHARHPNCAYAWMNYATSPAVQKQVVAVTGYSPANQKTAALLGPKESAALHITDLRYFNSLKFWKTPPNYPQWQQIWNEIKG